MLLLDPARSELGSRTKLSLYKGIEYPFCGGEPVRHVPISTEIFPKQRYALRWSIYLRSPLYEQERLFP